MESHSGCASGGLTLWAAVVFALIATTSTASTSTPKFDEVREGLWVHVGCRDGELLAEFVAGGGRLAHGVTDQPDDVERARSDLRTNGLYGRASVELCAYHKLPYANNTVNLIVVNRLVSSGHRLLGAHGVRKGLCVHIDCGEGALTAEVGLAGRHLVQGLTTRRENVDTFTQVHDVSIDVDRSVRPPA